MMEVDYLIESARSDAPGYHQENVCEQELDRMLDAVSVAMVWADDVKRALFYGAKAKGRTNGRTPSSLKHKPELRNLVHGAIGLFSEAGEILEHLHRVLRNEAEIDAVNLLEEIGDCEWYLACMHRFLGTTPSQAWDANIAKLRKRYPDGFTQEAATHRDLVAERLAVEEHVE